MYYSEEPLVFNVHLPANRFGVHLTAVRSDLFVGPFLPVCKLNKSNVVG